VQPIFHPSAFSCPQILVSKGWDVSQLVHYGGQHTPNHHSMDRHYHTGSNQLPHSPHLNMANNNSSQESMNSDGDYGMPPPNTLPVHSNHPQQSPTVPYSSAGPQIFQFSEAHFKNANSLAFSSNTQSPHAVLSPQTVPVNMQNKPDVIIDPTHSQPQFTLKTEDGRVLKLTQAELQATLLSSGHFQTSTPARENISDTLQGSMQYNDGEMLQDSSFDVPGTIDDSLLSQVTGNGQGGLNLFGEGDASMANDYMESQQDLPLSPQAFGDSSGSFNMSSLDQDSTSSGGFLIFHSLY
jgi:hypothetical protein